MNANRVINMVLRLLMRHGMKYLNRGAKPDPKAQEAAKKLRAGRKMTRF